MITQYVDFNNADGLISRQFSKEWDDISTALDELPLHLKASDQSGLQGNPIFDVVGTNEWIKNALVKKGWAHKFVIPSDYAFLGTDVDFGKNGVIVEVQFSNYPFLLNNVLRSELFFKAKMKLVDASIALIFIITKAHMFPASNSTLYYEQGANQLQALAKNNVFDVPIRLIGLFEPKDTEVAVKWTKYHQTRYSRTVTKREDRKCRIDGGKTTKSRCKLTVINP